MGVTFEYGFRHFFTDGTDRPYFLSRLYVFATDDTVDESFFYRVLPIGFTVACAGDRRCRGWIDRAFSFRAGAKLYLALFRMAFRTLCGSVALGDPFSCSCVCLFGLFVFAPLFYSVKNRV